MATMNVSLPQEMKDWVEELARTGDYANSSDVVRDLIRRERERRQALAELQALVDEGMASGLSDRSVDQIMQDARQRAREMLARRA
jgi:antitoxin ParD1/3/4